MVAHPLKKIEKTKTFLNLNNNNKWLRTEYLLAQVKPSIFSSFQHGILGKDGK